MRCSVSGVKRAHQIIQIAGIKPSTVVEGSLCPQCCHLTHSTKQRRLMSNCCRADKQTDKQMNRQTDRHTCTLIAILSSKQYFQKEHEKVTVVVYNQAFPTGSRNVTWPGILSKTTELEIKTKLNILCRFRSGSAITSLGASTKLLYVKPG